MTTLVLATRLHELRDDELISALEARTFRAHGVVDFFDLADALLAPHSVQEVLRPLDRITLSVWITLARSSKELSATEIAESLTAYPATRTIKSTDVTTSLNILMSSLLAYQNKTGYRAHTDTNMIRDILDPDPVLKVAPPRVLEPVIQVEQRFIDRRAAERAAHGVIAVSGLLAALEIEPARQLHKGGLSLPAVKRLAETLTLDHDSITLTVQLAARSKLISLDDGYWRPTETARLWLQESVESRWQQLVVSWCATLPRSLRELHTKRSLPAWGTSAREYFIWLYPLNEQASADVFDACMREATWLGISADSILSSAGSALLAGDAALAGTLLGSLLPTTVTKVYLQDDLSVVSPGSLAPEVSAQLRTLATVENYTLAPTFRFSRASLDQALTMGETEASIRAFLQDISLTGLPQPLDYLITDVVRRHGLLRVRQREEGTTVYSPDSSVLREIEVDRGLRSLNVNRYDEKTLITRLPLDTTYWLLRDARYPVVAEKADGSIETMIRPGSGGVGSAAPPRDDTAAQSRSTAALIARLRENASRTMTENTAAATEQRWLMREIDQAIRAHQLLRVAVTLADESTVRYTLEPTALSGGRLRGLDRGADIERTLPISRIISIEATQDEGSVD